MFKRILLSEILKIKYSKMLKVLLIALVAFVALFTLTAVLNQATISILSNMENSEGLQLYSKFTDIMPTLSPFTFFPAGSISLFSIVMTAVIAAYIGKEYKTTLRQTMIVVDDRKKYYLAKLLVVMVIFLAFSIVLSFINYGIYRLFAGSDYIALEHLGKVLLSGLSLYVLLLGLLSLYAMITVVSKHKVNIVLLVLLAGFVINILYMLIPTKWDVIKAIFEYFPLNLSSVILSEVPKTKYIIAGFISGIVLFVVPTIVGMKVIEKQDI